ncbi:uncharacterized protein PAC_08585 [Phialocephala subalpina]|uniref:Uncharacterized protein n=1 Tax=Phialocephala subalpina TaxID=576137 RepID=A0A1L7X107_9HELO|nr:uncharacterized protein PAC_08585 [Phialocephala subalpina]
MSNNPTLKGEDETGQPQGAVIVQENLNLDEEHDALRAIDIPENKWPSVDSKEAVLPPYTANAASATQYSVSVVSAMFGGPIIRAIGIPMACVIGAIGFPMSGSGFYVNSKYGIQWYLIAKGIYSFTSSFLYIAEAASMISYPEEHRRGFYLSIWVVQTPISPSLACNSSVGCATSPKKVAEKGSHIAVGIHKQKRTLLLISIYIFTYFGDGVWGTYMSLHFSVRARALGSFVGPLAAIFINPLFGMILDMKSIDPRRKEIITFWIWSLMKLPQPFVWINFIYLVSAWMSQTLIYLVLGQFASDVTTNARTGGVFRSWETVGQAVSYGINSKVSNRFVPLGIYFGLFVIAMPLFWMVLQELPVDSKVPVHVDEDGHVIEAPGKDDAALA